MLHSYCIDDLTSDTSVEKSAPTSSHWTCKKCTLVNSSLDSVCVVCGGSKLRSISSIEDQTLRKGEFWSCPQCTLKNSLAVNVCSACKAIRNILPSGVYQPQTNNLLERERERGSIDVIPEGKNHFPGMISSLYANNYDFCMF